MAIYTFGIFQLNTQTIKLHRGDEELELEPQVFNTLQYLVENHDRVVTKDELFEEVWHGRTLTDHVITRIIYELRKTLDDKSVDNSTIRTVRGKGYQFIAPVAANQATGIETKLHQENEANNTFKKKFIYPTTIVVLVLIILIMSGLLHLNKESETGSENKTSANVVSEVYQILSVLPIDVQAENDELAMLVQSLIDYLTYQLTQNFNMKVIHPDSLMSLSEQSNDLYAIQQATRSDFLIQGFIESNNEQSINVHLIMHKLNQDGTLMPFPLGAFEFPYPKNSKELNDLYKQRKITVRSIVEIIKPGITINSDSHFETDDPEAYRLVIAAHHMSRTDSCADMNRAEQLLLKAVERDERFVYAYLQLFMNYYKRVWICGESTDYHAKGLAMAAVVDRLAPGVFHAMDVRRTTILVESNKVEEAFEFSKNADWNNPSEIYDMSYSLRYAGFLNIASENVARILQLDPFFFSEKPILNAPNTLLYQNRFKEHLNLLAEPGSSYHDYFRGLNLYFTDDSDAAKTVLQGVVTRTPDDLFGQFSQALLHIIDGEFELAQQKVDEIVLLRAAKKHTDGEMTYKVAQLYSLAGADQKALEQFQASVNQGFFPMNYFLNDPAMASINETEKFKSIVQKATDRHLAFAEKFGLQHEALN